MVETPTMQKSSRLAFPGELVDRLGCGNVYVVHEQYASRPTHLGQSRLSFRLLRWLRTLDHVDFARRQDRAPDRR